MRDRPLFASAILATVFLAIIPSSAQDTSSAKAFLTAIFRLYDKGGNGIDVSSRYLHSSLIALVKADVQATGSDIPSVLDGDLLCGCQEWDGIWVFKTDLATETPKSLHAVVSFAIYAPKNRPKDDLHTVNITLVSERGQWRIYDVLYLAGPVAAHGPHRSLRKQLRDEISSYAHPSKQ